MQKISSLHLPTEMQTILESRDETATRIIDHVHQKFFLSTYVNLY